MLIQVGSAYGVGASEKSSLDSALKKLDIHNYNLVEYSSVIPEDVEIVRKDSFDVELPTGHPCAVVMAKDTVKPNTNETAIADLAYARSQSRGGIFIEGNGKFVSDKEVEELRSNRPSYNWLDEHQNISCKYKDDQKFVTVVSIAFFGGIEAKYLK